MRHNITARLFQVKLKLTIALIIKQSDLDMTLSFTYSVEWQKLGLPQEQSHLWLLDKIPPNNVDDCAKLPFLLKIVDVHHNKVGSRQK